MSKLLLIIWITLLPSGLQAAGFEKLGAFDSAWDGQKLAYPAGEPEITAIKVVLPPGGKMPFHCHPFATVGTILSGTLEVEKLNGEKQRFNKGDTIIEVSNIWHRGINPSDTEEVVLIGYYTGVKGVATTLMMTGENKAACQ